MNKRITLITNIKSLLYEEAKQENTPLRGAAMSERKEVKNAYLLMVDDRIADFGTMSHCDAQIKQLLSEEEIDLMGSIDAAQGYVIPGFCDSHTHILYPCSREGELFDRIRGLTYAQIAGKGGGILNSARKMEEMSDEELFEPALERLENMLAHGTTTIEIKSGYGLTLDQELRMLRIINQLRDETCMTIKSTFLGAHAIPHAYKKDPKLYVDLVIQEMIPRVAEEKLADYVDVFCEKGFFSVKESEMIFEEAKKYGLIPRMHTNQFTHLGGVACAIQQGARSVDHLEVLNDDEIALLSTSNTIATLLPGCSFFMNEPFPPARKLIDQGAAVALATDYNPGTNPSGLMPFVISLACLKMGMRIEEAIHAATINGAMALDCGSTQGSIAIGKRADLIITKPIPSLEYMAYAYTDNVIEAVYCAGQWI